MRAVLRWLFHYPDIRISWTGEKESRPRWTAYWSSEASRQMMIKTCADLKGLFGDMQTEKTNPRREPLNEGTPRITTPTFRALRRRKLIRAVERRVPRKGLTDMWYFQLTAEGKQAATGLKLIKAA